MCIIYIYINFSNSEEEYAPCRGMYDRLKNELLGK